MTQPAYMGGPIAPPVQGGLLQPSNYSYPLTSGLLSSLMPQQQQQPAPNSWSQLAYQMAGSPKQGGMYSSVATPPATGGSSGGNSSLAALLPLLGGLLGGFGGTNGNSGIAGALQGLLGGGAVPGSAAATGNLNNSSITPLSPGQLTDPVPGNLGGLADIPNFDLSGGTDQYLNDPVPADLGGLADIPQFFSSAGGQAATPSQSSLSLGQIANTGLSGLNLANAAQAGSGIGIAGAAANLAHNLGVPSSVTSPVSAGASLAGTGMQLASGNYLGVLGSLLGLGGKAAGISSTVSQPASLLMSVLTGNPLGMAVNGAKVGGGLLNMLQGLNYNGSWTPSGAQQQQIGASNAGSENQVAAQAGQDIAGNQNQISNPALTSIPSVAGQLAQVPQGLLPPPPGPTFTPQQLAQLGQSQAYSAATNLGLAAPGTYAGQPTNMMNQGEASTPVAPFSQDAMQYLAYQSAMQQAAGNPQLMQQVAQQFQGLMSA